MKKERQPRMVLPEEYYERIKARLYQRICRELRAAKRILDIGCGSCELDRLLAEQNGSCMVGVESLLRKAGFADARATVIYQKQLIWAQGRNSPMTAEPRERPS